MSSWTFINFLLSLIRQLIEIIHHANCEQRAKKVVKDFYRDKIVFTTYDDDDDDYQLHVRDKEANGVEILN